MIKMRDIGGLFLKSGTEGRPTIRQLWKRQAAKQRLALHALTAEYEKFQITIEQCNTAIKGKRKLSEILEPLLTEVGHILGSDYVFLSLLEGQPQVFWVVAYKGCSVIKDISLVHKFMKESYLAAQTVYISGENLSKKMPGLSSELFQENEQSLFGIPIMIDGKLAGVLETVIDGKEPLSKQQRKLAEVYAAQAGVVIKTAKLNDALERKSGEIELLHEVGRAVANQLSPSILLERVCRTLSDFLKVDACAAFVVQSHSTPLAIRAVHVQNLSSLDIDRMETLFSNGDFPETLHNAKQVLVTLPLAADKTVQVLPLLFRQILQGFIVFCWGYMRKTDEAQVEATLKTVATQTAMGLDREHLYGSIKKIGLTDTLTEIANRRFFDFILKKEINRARRYNQPLSLMMLDIDYFKKINDTWGHQIGDIILKELGTLLKQHFRATDLPARYGGEEFAVILPETNAVLAYTLAENLRAKTEKQVFAINNDRVPVTVSIGVATIETNEHLDKLAEADLILAADQSLYRAKTLGRNRVEASQWKHSGLKL